MRIIFCRIGWAKYYDGRPNDIVHKSSGIDKDFELYNFKDNSGLYYGYVRTRGKIHFEKIEKGYPKQKDIIENVLIVWFAKSPKGGQFVVGWYENATLFRNRQSFPLSLVKERDSERKIFLAKTAKAVLIPENKRNFQIPRGKSCSGQYDIWYGNDEWKNKVFNYIKNYSNTN